MITDEEFNIVAWLTRRADEAYERMVEQMERNGGREDAGDRQRYEQALGRLGGALNRAVGRPRALQEKWRLAG